MQPPEACAYKVVTAIGPHHLAALFTPDSCVQTLLSSQQTPVAQILKFFSPLLSLFSNENNYYYY